MRLFLDTHTFLWFVLGDPRLVQTAHDQIRDPAQAKLVSPASYWEIAIKIRLGKYTLNEPYEAFMQRGIMGNGGGGVLQAVAGEGADDGGSRAAPTFGC